MRVRLWIQQRHELPCALRKFQGMGCAMIGGEGDGDKLESSGVFGGKSESDGPFDVLSWVGGGRKTLLRRRC
ncbi:hypothetical protein Tco_1439239 [Tanacetum coccineum]